MAEFERAHNVIATFYVMPRSPYYNVFSHNGRALVRRIGELGHSVGVHADLNEPRDSKIGAVEAAERAASDLVLMRAVHRAVTRRVSFHCPPTSLLWREIPSFESAYAPEWEGHYRSDSRGEFAYGDPEDEPARPLQVNLHPEHWFPPSTQPAEGFWR